MQLQSKHTLKSAKKEYSQRDLKSQYESLFQKGMMFRISLIKEGLPTFVLTSKSAHRERGQKEAGRISVSVFEMVTIRRRKSVKATHIACREGGDTNLSHQIPHSAQYGER
jgi:hypothetical protein